VFERLVITHKSTNKEKALPSMVNLGMRPKTNQQEQSHDEYN
jgi:hypothetical protein